MKIKRAFTIVELLVAMGLLSALIAIGAVVFTMTSKAHRTGMATAEISRKLRVITDQLNADVGAINKDEPVAVMFEKDGAKRYDQIMFFANGDFQSYGSTPYVNGFVTRVYYGHANIVDYEILGTIDPSKEPPNDPYDDNVTITENYNYIPNDPSLPEDVLKKRVLARRQHVLTADTGPEVFPSSDPASFLASFVPIANNFYEYDKLSLTQWQNIYADPVNGDKIVQTCFGNTTVDNLSRGCVDRKTPETLHMLMAEGVSSFQIQFAYRIVLPDSTQMIRWWPSDDPDGDPDTADSDFGIGAMGSNNFGVHFNFTTTDANSGTPSVWFNMVQAAGLTMSSPPVDFFPEAIKFTFTLYDSKGVYPDGKTFTHIVYLGN